MSADLQPSMASLARQQYEKRTRLHRDPKGDLIAYPKFTFDPSDPGDRLGRRPLPRRGTAHRLRERWDSCKDDRAAQDERERASGMARNPTLCESDERVVR